MKGRAAMVQHCNVYVRTCMYAATLLLLSLPFGMTQRTVKGYQIGGKDEGAEYDTDTAEYSSYLVSALVPSTF